jgi:hypothetical protein
MKRPVLLCCSLDLAVLLSEPAQAESLNSSKKISLYGEKYFFFLVNENIFFKSDVDEA